MGVGGGFIMVPAMIYLIGMPTSVVIGTSLFQIAFVTAITSFLHAYTNQAVDIVQSPPHGGRSPEDGDALLTLVTKGSIQAAIY